jgi:hypothetical protein
MTVSMLATELSPDGRGFVPADLAVAKANSDARRAEKMAQLRLLPSIIFQGATPVFVQKSENQTRYFRLESDDQIDRFLSDHDGEVQAIRRVEAAATIAPVAGALSLEDAQAAHEKALDECQRYLTASNKCVAQFRAKQEQSAASKNDIGASLAEAFLTGADSPKADAKTEKRLADAQAGLAVERDASRIISREWAGAASKEFKARRDVADAKYNGALETHKKAMAKADQLRRELAEQEALAARATGEIKTAETTRKALAEVNASRARVQRAHVHRCVDVCESHPWLDDLLRDPAFPVDRAAIAEAMGAWKDGVRSPGRSGIYWPERIAIIFDSQTGQVFSIEIIATLATLRGLPDRCFYAATHDPGESCGRSIVGDVQVALGRLVEDAERRIAEADARAKGN